MSATANQAGSATQDESRIPYQLPFPAPKRATTGDRAIAGASNRRALVGATNAERLAAAALPKCLARVLGQSVACPQVRRLNPAPPPGPRTRVCAPR